LYGLLVLYILLLVVLMLLLMSQGFGLSTLVVAITCDCSSGRVCCPSVAVGVVEHGGAYVGHGACGPPGVAEPVEECYALLDLVGGSVDVDFETPRAEVAVHYAQGQ
jgi:hypothetical protein